jgi:alkanesulfonate monooxygenase SsuD/methylene tetrahydromethanopterin reductase-like flavin-dependent oxidoreductase (luciferase family)
MHLGYFGLMGYRHRGKSQQEVFREHVEQVIHADRLGFEIAWFAEHHFSNYCICPSPLIMAARCAGVTERIRLGPAVVVTPLYEPARLLAEIGMVDCLTEGRLVLGVGSGYQPYEFERFGKDLASAQAMLTEFLDMLQLAFSSETFSYEGRHYRMPTTHISARPVAGVPEIWIAGDNEFGHRLCARRGHVPMFTGRWAGADYQREMRARISTAYRAEGRDAQRFPLGVQRFMCVTANQAETLEYVDNARHQMRLANALRRRAEVMDGAMMIETPIPNEISLEQMASNLLVGDCETIAERLCEEIRAAQPSHMMFHFQVGASSQASALRTMEKLMLEIVPMVERELGPLANIGTPTRKWHRSHVR